MILGLTMYIRWGMEVGVRVIWYKYVRETQIKIFKQAFSALATYNLTRS